MAQPQGTTNTFPPVRACIFDLDGTLINSEDIYIEIYNNILHEYGKPDLPWSVNARMQSTGLKGNLHLLSWSGLPLSPNEWSAKVVAQRDLFRQCQPLPGVVELLNTLSDIKPPIHLAIASSAKLDTFKIKTSHLPSVTDKIPPRNCVFGDDRAMSDAKKKPMPDIFLIALERINEGLMNGESEVKPEECLVFEDSIAGVEAGRRAGMRVCWVPHKGLRDIWRGKEDEVMEGRTGEVPTVGEAEQGEDQMWSRDGWAETIMSLEDFRFENYGIHIKK